MERWRSPVKRARPESESPQGRGGSNPPRSVRADVAQLAEPLPCKQQVAGSMPAVGLRGCTGSRDMGAGLALNHAESMSPLRIRDHRIWEEVLLSGLFLCLAAGAEETAFAQCNLRLVRRAVLPPGEYVEALA